MTERNNELLAAMLKKAYNAIGACALDLNQCSVQLADETDYCFATGS